MGKSKRTTDRARPQAANAPPRPRPQDAGKFAKLIGLLKKHPGQTAIELQHLGWRPETDGELTDAEKAGLIAWVHGKWYAV